MKIAIVCGHFLPELGFIEVYLAKEYSKVNHEVKVFTSSVIPKYVRGIVKKKKVDDRSEQIVTKEYSVLRLKPIISLGQMIYVRNLIKHVHQFNPEIVIVIGVGKLFPESLYTRKDKSYKLITLLGDSSDNYLSNKLKVVEYVKNKLKQKVYQKAIKFSDKLLPYTPETIGLVKGIVDQKYHSELVAKSNPISLGFDSEIYHYQPKLRSLERKKLNIPYDARVLITATRIVPNKRLEKVIDWVEEMNRLNKPVYYIIVGFLENDYSEWVKRYIKSKKYKDKFYCYPFLNHSELNKLFMVADIAFYPTAAITIFETIATGLLAVLPDKKNINHIVDDEKTGWYIRNGKLKEAFMKAYDALNDPHFDREKIARINEEKYAFKNIAKRILDIGLSVN